MNTRRSNNSVTVRAGYFTMFLLCLIALLPAALRAQSGATGALAVTVTDPSGAVVGGATVRAANAAGVSRTLTTGGDGSAVFTLLPPGEYHVSISATGFQTIQIPSVAVNVTETNTVKQALQVGAQQQQVTVTTEVQAIQTETSTLGTVIGNAEINSLPLVTRNFTQIASLSPGVTANVYNASALGRGGVDWAVNGQDPTSNNVLMEGSSINNMTTGQNSNPEAFYGDIATPSPDAIQEFKVQTSLFDAAYGRQAGGSVNVILKSGTNSLHGSLFEFLRNDDLNANDFFANRAGLPRGDLKQNQFGGTAGGPLKKDKLFWFLSYQGTRQVNGVAAQGFQTVQVPAQLTNSRSAAALGAAFCPANNPVGQPGATFAYTFDPTPGGINPASDQVACNGSNISPVALRILNATAPGGQYLIPSPGAFLNAGAANEVGIASITSPATYSENQYIGNVDYILSQRETISGRYFFSYGPENRTFNCSPCTLGSGVKTYSGNQFATLKSTTLLRPNLVNEARMSYYYIRAEVNTTDPLTHSSLGIQNYALNGWIDNGPVISVPGLFTQGGTGVDGDNSPQNAYEWADQLSWNKGRHTLRFGYDQLLNTWPLAYWAPNRGSVSFSSFPDFLLGLSAAQNGTNLSNISSSGGGQTAVGGQPLDLHVKTASLYAQDDFKVNPRLTLNAGVRWEYDGFAYDRDGNHVDFWINQAATVPIPPITGTLAGYTEASNYVGTLPAGVIRRGVRDQTANGAPKDDFAPRIGFAWQPFSTDGRFVVRGGAGLYYSQININNMATTDSNNPPAYAAEGFSGAANAGATWLQPWTANTTLGFGTFTRFPNSTLSSGTVDPNLTVPVVYNENLNVQYQFLKSWLLQVGYVGSRGVRLWGTQPLNIPAIVQPNTPGINNLATPLPGVNCANLVASGGTGCVLVNTPTNYNQRVPIVGFTAGGIRESLDNVGDSDFSSLQVTLRKRLTRGLTLQGAYTWSKTITDITGVERGGSVNSNDPTNHEQQRGPADFSRPQRFVLNYTYNFPSYGSGRGLRGKLLSGWGTSGVATIQDGLPLTLTDSLGGAIYGGAGVSRAEICPAFTYG